MDTLAISVRRATADDAPALAQLVNEAFAVERFFVDGDRTCAAEILELTRSGAFLVLEDTEGLAAAIHFHRRGATAQLGMLAVRPALQGLGLGKRLVRIAEALAEALGATTMTLEVVDLREELGRWYRSLGYRTLEVRPFSYRPVKQPCHLISMFKRLGTGLALEAVAAHGA